MAELLTTGDEILVEGNNWGDTYWGAIPACMDDVKRMTPMRWIEGDERWCGHPTHVRGFETIQEAAEWIENMRYDGLRDFMGHLHNALRGRAAKDRFDGKIVLAHRLERLADRVGEAEEELKAIWDLCEKHMVEGP